MQLRLSLIIVAILLASKAVLADPRPFTFVYDTYPEGKGNVEYEQWLTYSAHSRQGHSSTSYALRHEFEFGLADNFDLSLYLASWRYEQNDVHEGTRFDLSSIEGIVYRSNPVTDFVGIGLYTEIGMGQN